MPNNVAQNAVVNMAEDLTMMVGYSVVNQYLHDRLKDYFPAEVDENGNEKMNIPLEVLSGGASYLFMSAMMKLIQKEEKFIEYLFAGAEAVIVVLYARNKGWITSMKNKIMPLKGAKAVSKFKTLQSQTDNTNSFISQVYQAVQAIMQGRDTSSVTDTINAGTAQMDHSLNRERTNLAFANAHNKSFNDSLLIKMASGNFTELDEQILKRVIGRTNFEQTPIDHNELNKIQEFMMLKDSNGNFIGLTKAFQSMINGLGFINK